MTIVQIKMTQLQKEETAHKIVIISEDPGLQVDYSITSDEALELAQRFMLQGDGIVRVEAKYLGMIVEELRDRMDSAYSNWKDCGDDSEGGVYRSLVSAVKKIAAVSGRV